MLGSLMSLIADLGKLFHNRTSASPREGYANPMLPRASRLPFHDRVRLIDEHDEWVKKYVERCDPAQSLQYLAMEICYIAAARIRIVLYYSILMSRKRKEKADASHNSNVDRSAEGASHGVSEAEPDSETLREQIFAGSIIILKRICDIILDSRLDRWAWHCE